MAAEPRVHPVVDHRVDAGVGHGQPVEREVDVADMFILTAKVLTTLSGKLVLDNFCRAAKLA